MKIQHYLLSSVVVSLMLLGFLSPTLADEYEDAARLLKQGRHAAALKKVDAAIAANPNEARARFLKGLILAEQNQAADAISVFTSLTNDYPELPEPYNNLAVLYAAQGQYDQARDSLEMAIRTHPSYTVAHENLGDVYAKMASEAYDKALSLDRSNQTAQTKLSLIRELFSGARTLTSAPAQAAAASAPDNPVSATTQSPATSVTPPAVTTAATKPAEDRTQEVISSVNRWAQAWTDKNTSEYLSHYAQSFEPPGKATRSEWEKTRRARIERPKFIKVSVIKPKVTFSANGWATVDFQQDYKSDAIDSVGRKTLTMVKLNNRWLIVKEHFYN